MCVHVCRCVCMYVHACASVMSISSNDVSGITIILVNCYCMQVCVCASCSHVRISTCLLCLYLVSFWMLYVICMLYLLTGSLYAVCMECRQGNNGAPGVGICVMRSSNNSPFFTAISSNPAIILTCTCAYHIWCACVMYV